MNPYKQIPIYGTDMIQVREGVSIELYRNMLGEAELNFLPTCVHSLFGLTRYSFSIAEESFRTMLNEKENQCIIIRYLNKDLQSD